jgi:hypothetical protein
MKHLPDVTFELLAPETADTPKKLPGRYDRIHSGAVAEIALQLVYAREYGDAGGKTPPAELVNRAVEIAELTFETLVARGHAFITPAHDDLQDESTPVGFAASLRAAE